MTKLLVPSHVAAERRGEHVYPDLITVVGLHGIHPIMLEDNSPGTAMDAYLRIGRGARTFHIKNNPLGRGER